MKQVTLFKLFTLNQDEALRFYTEKLGFELAEDARLGGYRWLLVRAPDNREVSIQLELAATDEERALVGRQGGRKPMFGIATDDCLRDYRELCSRGVRFESGPQVQPYGTGATLEDLYGNRIYLNQEPV
jgi:catechol 2,3-dioxygenase-like lactoylglutathione lyase family enzyme